MRQLTLATVGFDKHRTQTRRDVLLAEMDRVVPWRALCAEIEPFYPKRGNGRPPVGLERMLRLHFLQHWFNLSDPAAEKALYESVSMRQFVGIDLGREPVPDETTILNFRHLLERLGLGKRLFEQVNEHLASHGLKVAGGTIVDATIIAAPSSTKNEARQRDPEMHQTRKGQQWYFGMKLHIGVDSKLKLIHSLLTTAANVHDGTVLGELLHGGESRVYGDQAYQGRQAAIREHAPKCKGLHQPALSLSRDRRRGGARQEPYEVVGSRQGRASVPCDQAGVWLCQSPLPGLGEEPRTPVGDVRACQSVHRP